MESGFEIECVIVGAGVVGLACARALARAGADENLAGKQEVGRKISPHIHLSRWVVEERPRA